jgi:hypothetical protein
MGTAAEDRRIAGLFGGRVDPDRPLTFAGLE